jgi:hypothetical protein
MSTQKITTKNDLITNLDDSWKEFSNYIEIIIKEKNILRKDSQGWKIKDHIIHLSAWENSVVQLLLGKPRYLGLGVDKILYENGCIDDINAEIIRKNIKFKINEVKEICNNIHLQLIRLLHSIPDEDLNVRCRDYNPDEDDDRLLMEVILSNTIRHYEEHREWISSIIK